MSAPQVPLSGRMTGWLALALVAVTLVTYAGIWSLGFVNFDDPQYISNNPHVATGLSAANVVWAFTSAYAANWHPATWASHMIDVTLFGVAPGPMHLVSLAIHVANVLLLFAFLLRTTGAAARSAIVAALFAVHPLHVESVSWISERKDVLSAFFGLCTLLAYVAYVRRPTRARGLVVLALFALALMAKPMLVTLPVVLLLIDYWPLNRPLSWALVREKVPLFALTAASIAVTVVAQHRAAAIAPLNRYSVPARLVHVVNAFTDYLVAAVWPTRLAVFYPLSLTTPGWRIVASSLLFGAATYAAIAFARRRPYVIVGWLWYVVMILPVSGLVQVGSQGLADRYTYLPLIGIFVIAEWGLADLLATAPRARRAVAVGACVLIAIFAVVAHRQLQVWRDSTTLWTHALEVTHDNYRAEEAVGALLVDAGRLDEGVAHLTEAVRLEPAFAIAHSNLGTALAKRGQFDEAIQHYREALRLSPGLAQAHNNLGLALARTGDVEGAVREIREAVRLAPERPDFQHNLAMLLRQSPIP